MIDVQCCNKSLKMKWVRQSWQMEAFLDFHLQKYEGKVVFLSNLNPQDVP